MRKAGAIVLLAVLGVLGLLAVNNKENTAVAETAAPGFTLNLTAAENPANLQPVDHRTQAEIWSKVRGHKPYGFNVQLHSKTLDEEIRLIKEAGGTVARIGVGWDIVRSTETGPWNYTLLDAEYKKWIAAGIRPLLTIGATPSRFSQKPGERWAPPTTAALPQFGTFVKDVATRYPLAAGIEIWNEPNVSVPFWGGLPVDAKHYTQMVAYAASEARKVRPNIPILGGAVALTGYYQSTEAWSARMYIRALLGWGIQPWMDALSFHAYFGSYNAANDPRPVTSTSLYKRQQWDHTQLIKTAYEEAGKTPTDRLVATEFGASVTDGWTEEAQSFWLHRQFTGWDVGHTGWTPLAAYVDGAFAHETVDNPTHSEVKFRGNGFYRAKGPDGKYPPRPVACAYRQGFGYATDCPPGL